LLFSDGDGDGGGQKKNPKRDQKAEFFFFFLFFSFSLLMNQNALLGGGGLLLRRRAQSEGGADGGWSVRGLQLGNDLVDLRVGESDANRRVLWEQVADGGGELLQLGNGCVGVRSNVSLDQSEELSAKSASVLTLGLQSGQVHRALTLLTIGRAKAELGADGRGVGVVVDEVDNVTDAIVDDLVADGRKAGNECANLVQILGDLLDGVVALDPVLDQTNDLDADVAVTVANGRGLLGHLDFLGTVRRAELELAAQRRGILVLLDPLDCLLNTIIDQGVAWLLPCVWSKGANDLDVLLNGGD